MKILGPTHFRQSIPSTFDPLSPLRLTGVSAPYRAQAWSTITTLGRLDELGFSTFDCTFKSTGMER